MTPLLQRIDHINIVVKDLQKVASFFLSLGFALEDRSKLSGEWISKTVGLIDVEAEYVKLTLPGDSTSIELIRFESPPLNEIPNPEKANTQGFRHLAFRVSDIEKTVAQLKQKGIDPVSAIQEYSKTKKKLVYFRGPEGILLELAQYAETPGIHAPGPSHSGR
jgi:catechol 2,3-dioxygenase-like lactoylglutathione lyase family enzyme